jgi:hypothetical protein
VLEDNERWLKHKCYSTEGPYLRPFAPNIKWQEATVFVVGLNPATPLRDEFSTFDYYWDALTKHPERYFGVYRNKYKKDEEEISRTSNRISELKAYLSPHNVLVTNLYAYPTTNPKKIPRWIKQEPLAERILIRLLSICKPKVLLFHGREARLFGNKYFNVELNPYIEPTKQGTLAMLPGVNSPCWLFSYHHFVGRVKPKTVVSKHIKQFAQQIHLRILN